MKGVDVSIATGREGTTRRRPRAQTVVACAALLAAYLLLSLWMNPRGHLGGGDTGARVATLEAMDASGSLRPDLGYWAERWDPTGTLHPMAAGHVSHIGRYWVGVGTLPTLYLALPLYEVGGYRATLLLPMLGALAAALAARRLASTWGGGGTSAFWLVGLTSPLLLYTQDFWDHAIGVGLMMWALVFLQSAVSDGRPLRDAALAGLLFGFAGVMRTEAYAFGAAAGVVAIGVLVARRDVRRALVVSAALLVGVAALAGANGALERAALGDQLRAERSTATARGALTADGESGTAPRRDVALWTATGLVDRTSRSDVALGVAFSGLLLAAALLARRRADPALAVAVLAAAGGLLAVRIADGVGYVPGLVPAAPLAALGLVFAADLGGRARAAVATVAAGAVLVWATQYTDNVLSQWGARYLLLAAVVLTTVAAVALARVARPVAAMFLALTVAVTVFGLTWVHVKTDGYGDALTAIARRPEPVVVSRVQFLFRQSGELSYGRRWLTAMSDTALADAARVVRAAGLDSFAVVDVVPAQPATLDGFCRGSTDDVPFLPSVSLHATTYTAGPCAS